MNPQLDKRLAAIARSRVAPNSNTLLASPPEYDRDTGLFRGKTIQGDYTSYQAIPRTAPIGSTLIAKSQIAYGNWK